MTKTKTPKRTTRRKPKTAVETPVDTTVTVLRAHVGTLGCSLLPPTLLNPATPLAVMRDKRHEYHLYRGELICCFVTSEDTHRFRDEAEARAWVLSEMASRGK